MDLPEIQTAVSRFLSESDLVAAALVCKGWNASFTPALYSTIWWGISWKRPTLDAVVANADRIRHLFLLFGQFDLFLDNCTRLDSVELHTSLWRPDTWSSFITLLQWNPSIKSVLINHSGPKMPMKVMETISSCSGLRVLNIDLHDSDPTNIEPILDMAIYLEVLKVAGLNWRFPESLDKWPCFPNMKRLDFRLASEVPIPFLGFIRKCPALKTLNWVGRGIDLHPLSEFCDILKTHCPLIERLELMGGSSTEEEHVQILDSGHRFVSLWLERSGFGERAFQSLSRHFGSLQELHLRATGLTSAMAQQIMTSCPRLILFEGATLEASDILGIAQVEEAESGSGSGSGSLTLEQPQDWVCTHLQSLKIFICGLEGKSLEWYRKIMQQLAKLIKLQSLILGPAGGGNRFPQGVRDGLNLSLEAGLDVLSNLKELKVLNCDGVWQQLEKQDVRWMIEAWPKLKHVCGNLNDDRNQQSILKRLLEKKGVYVEANDDYVECDSRSTDDSDYEDELVRVTRLEENDSDNSDNPDDFDDSDSSESPNAS